jgi:hypothetical protein
MVYEKVVDDTKELHKLTEMPEVVDDAVNASQKDETTSEAAGERFVDNKGREFDPSIHKTDENGKPVYTPTGRFRKITIPNKRQTITPDQAAGLSPTGDVGGEYKLVARTLVGIFVQTGYAIVGEEWLPEKTKGMDEQANLEQVTESYCRSIEMQDLPPGVVVAVAYIGYGLRRFTKPKTKTVVQKVGASIKGFFGKLWRRKNNARPNTGDHTERQDDNGVQDRKRTV